MTAPKIDLSRPMRCRNGNEAGCCLGPDEKLHGWMKVGSIVSDESWYLDGKWTGMIMRSTNPYDLIQEPVVVETWWQNIAPSTDEEPLVVSPSDPHWTIAGIRQFGLAADGSDLRDLDTAIMRGFAREAAQRAEIERLRRALEQSAEWFDGYAASHTAKGDTDKAKRNSDRADACRAALEKPAMTGRERSLCVVVAVLSELSSRKGFRELLDGIEIDDSDTWSEMVDALAESVETALETKAMTEDQIKHMVDRFLMWKLPENFRPDDGISFKATYNENTPWPMKHEPMGTNLFDATQAIEMVRFMIEGIPKP